MKNFPIDKFWTKLMASSRSVNKIPYEYLSYAQNLRIYDGGVWVRKGFTSVYEGWQGNNNGGFVMNGIFYQVESGKIYKLDTTDGTRTEISDLWYDARIDVLVSQNSKGTFTSVATESVSYTLSGERRIVGIRYYEDENKIKWFDAEYDEYIDLHNLANDIRGNALPAIKILDGGSPSINRWGTNSFYDWTWYILTDLWRVYPDYPYVNTGSFSIQVWYYSTTEVAIITSNKRDVQVFDGVSLSSVTLDNTGIIEFMWGRSFLSASNVLKASRSISLTNPEYAYDWAGVGSYQIIYDTEIGALTSTLWGLYVFTKNKVEYLSAWNSVSGLSLPIWRGGEVMNQFCAVSSGEKIFYLTKNLEIETINFISGTSDTQVGRLSSQKIVNIREYLQDLDLEQPTAYAFNNRNEQNIQFFVRREGSQYNDVCIIYDLVNDTWNIDTGRAFSYVVEYNQRYYTFSDLNASVYLDGEGYTDDGNDIDSLGETQNMNLRSPTQKIFGGFYTAGAISQLSKINYSVEIDELSVFNQTLNGGNVILDSWLWDSALWDTPLGWETFAEVTNPFNIEANEGRIWQYWNRIKIKFSWKWQIQIQNFLIDTLGIRFEPTQVTLINNTF